MMLTLLISDFGADFDQGPRLLSMPGINLDSLLDLLLEAPLAGAQR